MAFVAVMVTVACVLAAWSRLLHERPSWNGLLGALEPDAGSDPEPAHPDDRPRRVAPDREADPAALRGQLLFTQPMTGGLIALDCLLTDESYGEAGWPVHVVAALPANVWLAAVEQELLQHWLDQGEVVSVSVSGEPSAPRVRIACHRTTLLLDQQPA